jgi:hypothetical protein
LCGVFGNDDILSLVKGDTGYITVDADTDDKDADEDVDAVDNKSQISQGITQLL